jgi:diaminohydroxyphosphoribosylaminopyrimidine deaminase/5-amino-6-(5-phosphoribosylamino)uracil reductase
MAGSEAENATLYVTLEPCCHYGRTPPCVDAIKAAKIKNVFFGFKDPNPLVAGKGQQILIEAGIPCEKIDLSAIDIFYRSYKYWFLHKLPWVTLKLAITLDGKIAHEDSAPAQISGEELQIFTHHLRLQSDAILSTINTIIHDDPQLNVRLSDGVIAKNIYLLDSQLRLPLSSKIIHTAKNLTLFHTKDYDHENHAALCAAGVRCIQVLGSIDGVDIKSVIKQIGADGVHDLWVEAGSHCFNNLFYAKLIDEIYFYIAPKTLGAQAKSVFFTPTHFTEHFNVIQWDVFGEDVVCHLTNTFDRTKI